MRVEQVTASETHGLRHEVLRPRQSIAEVGFPGDDDLETGHFAVHETGGPGDGRGTSDPGGTGGPGDGRGTSGTVGTGDGRGPIGVVTVLHQPPPLPTVADPAGWWRLRGMATAEHHRGSGVGSALVNAVLAYLAAHEGTVLWCHARLPAVGFYEKQGFLPIGDPWEEPALGPHVTMWRSVPRPKPT